jgi:F-box/WD-40 domain protein 5
MKIIIIALPRYLYVNCRQWPHNYTIDDPLEPPPIAQEIDIHVIDLLTFREVGMVMRSHKAFTPNDECFFLFLDVSPSYVAR